MDGWFLSQKHVYTSAYSVVCNVYIVSTNVLVANALLQVPNRTYNISADTAEDQEEWLSAIRSVLSHLAEAKVSSTYIRVHVYTYICVCTVYTYMYVHRTSLI